MFFLFLFFILSVDESIKILILFITSYGKTCVACRECVC